MSKKKKTKKHCCTLYEYLVHSTFSQTTEVKRVKHLVYGCTGTRCLVPGKFTICTGFKQRTPPAVRSKISSKLIFCMLCMILRSRLVRSLSDIDRYYMSTILVSLYRYEREDAMLSACRVGLLVSSHQVTVMPFFRPRSPGEDIPYYSCKYNVTWSLPVSSCPCTGACPHF